MERDVTIRPAGLTIVGGQPTPEPGEGKIDVPMGIERLLSRAAEDEAFAERLIANREETLAHSGIDLSHNERTTLSSVTDGALRTMIEAVRTRPRSVDIR